jgi:A/G-specific adenine glycosylase
MTIAEATTGRNRADKAAHRRAPDTAALLAWYDRHRRDLPWRAKPGQRQDPYRVWLSEIMLQQTTVKAVAPYYARFVARWPTIKELAAAKRADVLRLWAGLGYYARARNLHACARAVVAEHQGRFPTSEDALRKLPGIGAYTAAAIAAIAHDRKATPIDGNIERVVARLFAVKAALPAAKPEIRALAQTLTPCHRPGDFAQALMDLGATLCTPKQPSCAHCPWAAACAARRRGDAESFPRKAAKAEGRLRRGAAFVALRDGAVLMRTRPPKGLLGGMTEVPTTEWLHEFDERKALAHVPRIASSRPPLRGRPASQQIGAKRRPVTGSASRMGDKLRKQNSQLTLLPDPPPQGGREKICWRRVPGIVRHVFTHFPLELVVYRAEVGKGAKAPRGTRFVPLHKIGGEALPNVMRKVIAHALEQA